MTFGDAFPAIAALAVALGGWFYAKHIVRKSRRDMILWREAREREAHAATPAE